VNKRIIIKKRQQAEKKSYNLLEKTKGSNIKNKTKQNQRVIWCMCVGVRGAEDII
jgi:hypothetical protein